MVFTTAAPLSGFALNESPSEKEGKSRYSELFESLSSPSMKVPPKRKGNRLRSLQAHRRGLPSMKVPPKRKGNRQTRHQRRS